MIYLLTAFILITTEMSNYDVLISKLKLITRIKGIYIVYGVYDAIIKVEAGTYTNIKKVLNEIKNNAEIKSANTLIAL